MLAPRSSGRNPKVSIKTLFVYLATATTLACSGGRIDKVCKKPTEARATQASARVF
jgi:hypothetical protein